MKTEHNNSGRVKRRLCVIAVGVTALSVACTAEAHVGGRPSTPASRGWIGAEPPADSASGHGVAGSATRSAAPSEYSSDKPAAEAVALPPGVADSIELNGETPVGVPTEPLRAGNVDDNAKFDEFLQYLGRIDTNHIARRALDPSGRIVITAVDQDGKPVAGTTVTVKADGKEVAKLVTTGGGRALFHPAAYGAPATSYEVSTSAGSETVAPGAAVTVRADATQAATPAIDVEFVIDATGSMGDEIDRLKSTVSSVVDRVSALPGSPSVRLALTAYRDTGDAYVTATYDFTDNLGEFRDALAKVNADGGGDQPEALDEGLADALNKPSWRPAGSAAQMMFVIGDAPGHAERKVAQPYTDTMKLAAERGIKIFPIATSSSDDAAEAAFRQMAQFTGSRFVFMSYGAAGAATGSGTNIAPTDYEEMSLDDLVVRLIQEELAARGDGSDPAPTSTTTVPATSTTSPTPTTVIPPGQ